MFALKLCVIIMCRKSVLDILYRTWNIFPLTHLLSLTVEQRNEIDRRCCRKFTYCLVIRAAVNLKKIQWVIYLYECEIDIHKYVIFLEKLNTRRTYSMRQCSSIWLIIYLPLPSKRLISITSQRWVDYL